MEDMRGSEGIIALNPPQLIQATLTGTGTSSPIGLSDPFPPNLLVNYNPSTVAVKARARDQQAATVYQWNIASEVLLPWESTFELAYVGNTGRNLLTIVPVNTVEFGQDGSVAANRPYPGWQQIDNIITQGASRLPRSAGEVREALLARTLRAGVVYLRARQRRNRRVGRRRNGVQVNVKPDLSNVEDALRSERGPNGQIARQRFTLSEVWQLPIGRGRAIGGDMNAALDALVGGWQLSTIWTARSGLPVNVSLAGNGVDPTTGLAYSFLNRNGGALRPNQVGDPTDSDPASNRFTFLDPAAFALQPLNTPGNAKRNAAWGPGSFTVDVSLVKRFDLGRRYVDARLEAFNALNTTNYQNPSATWGSSTFGVISDAYAPRVVQMAIRFAF